MKAAAFEYSKPAAIEDAILGLAAGEGDAKAMAGGCSLGPMLNLRLARPSQVVDLRGIESLRALGRGSDSLRIGAGWTHAAIEDGVVPDVTRGLMPRVAGGIAYRAVRNRGTLGGSLAHADPAADWVTTALVLDAELHIRGSSGERRERMGGFMTAAYTTTLADDEVIVAIEIPVLSDDARWAYHKIARKTGEFAQAIGAVVFDGARDLVRVVAGAVEAPPILLEETSAALQADGLEAARASAGAEIERRLATHGAVFRQLHRVAVERALAEAMSP